MNRPSIVRVAHRGASGQYPENTLLAFRRALEQGLDALEIDIHRTADDELVMFHDSTLEQTTNGHGKVCDHSFQGIRQLDPSPQDGSLTPREICTQTLRAGANCLSYNFRFLTTSIVTECRLTRLALWPWDPDESAEIQQVLRLGVQGVMTNRPDILNTVLHDFTF